MAKVPGITELARHSLRRSSVMLSGFLLSASTALRNEAVAGFTTACRVLPRVPRPERFRQIPTDRQRCSNMQDHAKAGSGARSSVGAEE